MKNALDQMMHYATNNNLRVIVAMTPDIHSMDPYKFTYIRDYKR